MDWWHEVNFKSRRKYARPGRRTDMATGLGRASPSALEPSGVCVPTSYIIEDTEPGTIEPRLPPANHPASAYQPAT